MVATLTGTAAATGGVTIGAGFFLTYIIAPMIARTATRPMPPPMSTGFFQFTGALGGAGAIGGGVGFLTGGTKTSRGGSANGVGGGSGCDAVVRKGSCGGSGYGVCSGNGSLYRPGPGDAAKPDEIPGGGGGMPGGGGPAIGAGG